MKSNGRKPDKVPGHRKQAWIRRRDIFHGVGLLALAPLAVVLAPATWPRLCSGIGRLSGRLQGRRLTVKARRIEQIFGPALPRPAIEIATAHIGASYALQLHLLRMSMIRNWRPSVALRGQEHLQQALAEGNGAVLWIANIACASLVQKQAMAEAGYWVSHLSRPSHGFSPTTFGRRFLNPIRVAVEERFVRERILLDDNSATAALRRMRARLSENGLVSITEAKTGAQTVTTGLFDGRITLATGAPRLALSAAAPLLPVFARRTGPSVFEVEVGAPLAPDTAGNHRDFVAAAVGDYAHRLEGYLCRAPEQWAGWYNVADAS